MDSPQDAPKLPPPTDEVNRLWQHGMHEERLFHDRLNYFSALQVGLLGVFAILYQKEPAVGVFLLARPGEWALAVIWIIGIYAIVFGLALIALAFRLRSWHRGAPAPTGV